MLWLVGFPKFIVVNYKVFFKCKRCGRYSFQVLMYIRMSSKNTRIKSPRWALNTSFLRLWKVEGAFVRPKGITMNSHWLCSTLGFKGMGWSCVLKGVSALGSWKISPNHNGRLVVGGLEQTRSSEPWSCRKFIQAPRVVTQALKKLTTDSRDHSSGRVWRNRYLLSLHNVIQVKKTK